jgi:Domain of unknown function (DUF4832)/Domain of unknown function (DUF4874)
VRLAVRLCAALALVAGAHQAIAMSDPATRHVVYAADRSDFPNPERGFSKSKGSGTEARAVGLTLVHVYFRLDAFKNAPLPQGFLDEVSRRFADARESGVKLVPRFTYNFPHGQFDAAVDGDAPLARVLQHIHQLAPILRENADVIAFMEAGFVGAWGEWHDSTNGLDALPAKRAILTRLLDILPPSRAVVLRYERDKRAILGRDKPISFAEAFKASAVARVGHHNDCFLASENDWDTYRPTSQRSIPAAKAYLAAENRYVPQGGETCNIGADAQPYIGCKTALKELADQHWSQLNSDYHLGVLGLWKRQGCYSEISKGLGYRLRLVRSDYPARVRRGGSLSARLVLVNEGFAAPYNPRLLELVLRGSGGSEFRLKLPQDPRRWLPGAPISLNLAARLPKAMPRGVYDAYLALPDPAPRLRSRPDYAIRLANAGTWDPQTGENALGWRLRVR